MTAPDGTVAPSVKRVVDHLRVAGPQTSQQIREATGVGRRTVYDAVKRLAAEGRLTSRANLRDTRQTVHTLLAGCPCDGVGRCATHGGAA